MPSRWLSWSPSDAEEKSRADMGPPLPSKPTKPPAELVVETKTHDEGGPPLPSKPTKPLVEPSCGEKKILRHAGGSLQNLQNLWWRRIWSWYRMLPRPSGWG